MTSGERRLYSDVLDKCIRNNITFRLLNKRTNGGCSGSFNDKDFMVCFNRPDWLGIFVHESCHLDQYLEGCQLWKNTENDVDIWNANEYKKNPKVYLRSFKNLCRLEIDCDQRVLEKIEKYRLKINIEKYIVSANIYYASYYYFYKYLCFYDVKNIPYWDGGFLNGGMFPVDRISTFKEAWKARRKLGEYIRKNNTPFKSS